MFPFPHHKLLGVYRSLCWLGCVLHDISANGDEAYAYICLNQRKVERVIAWEEKERGSERMKRAHEDRNWRMWRVWAQRERTGTWRGLNLPRLFQKRIDSLSRASATLHVHPEPIQPPASVWEQRRKGMRKRERARRRARSGREGVRKGGRERMKERHLLLCGWVKFHVAGSAIYARFLIGQGAMNTHCGYYECHHSCITPSGFRQAGKCLKRLVLRHCWSL